MDNIFLNNITDINIFFDRKIILVGGIIDTIEEIGDYPFKDLDILIEKKVFYEKFLIKEEENIKKLKIEKDNFQLEYKQDPITSFSTFSGLYREIIPLDFFVIDGDRESENIQYKIHKKVLTDYREIILNQTSKSRVSAGNSLLKIEKPQYRIKDLEYLLNLDDSNVTIEWHKRWLNKKKEVIPSKLEKYYQKYPEYKNI